MATSVKSQFWSAFYKRTVYWAYVSERYAAFLSDCALAQACFESTNFTSNIFQNSNNAIGYKYYPGSIWDSGYYVGGNGVKWQKFASIADCANELADWVHRRKSSFINLDGIDDYCKAMKNNGYFEEPLEVYLNGLPTYFVSTPGGSLSDDQPSGVVEVVREVFGKGNMVIWIVVGIFVFLLWATGLLKVIRRFFKR